MLLIFTRDIKALMKEGWLIINLCECDLKSAEFEKMLTALLKKNTIEYPVCGIVYNSPLFYLETLNAPAKIFI